VNLVQVLTIPRPTQGLICRGRTALLLLPALVGLASCKTSSPSYYISPRVTGCVLDAETKQPVVNVRVRRQTANQSYKPIVPPKGGEQMENAPQTATTDREGIFTLGSIKDLGIFFRPGWFTVTLALEHSGYERAIVSYGLSDATNAPSGEPLIQAGNILIIPVSKESKP
jgi:hypothetical protein